MRYTLLVSLFFVLFAFFQTSFLSHFPLFGIIPNLFLVCLLVFLVFWRRDSLEWLLPALLGGFVLDMSSPHFIGFWPLVLAGLGFLLQFLKQKYFLLLRFSP